MAVVRIKEKVGSVLEYYHRGVYPANNTGFANIDEYWKPRLGNTTIITGYPSMGKTEFTLQILVNCTMLHGWKHALYTPETGTSEEVILELVHKATGKTAQKGYANTISEMELLNATNYLDQYFYIIEPDEVKGLTVNEWYEDVQYIIKETKIHTATIDNWNDLTHDLNNYGGKISEYLKHQLPRFNRFCKSEMIHGFILAHPKSPEKLGGSKLPPAKPNDIEGGSLWWAKAQSLITIHRDLENEQDKTTQVIVHKAKPKIVGKQGFTSLHYHIADGCYSIDGTRQTQPVSYFKEANNIEIIKDIIPF